MLDPRLIRDDPDTVRASQRARGEDEGLVDAVIAADLSRRETITRFDRLRAEQKDLGRQVAKASGDEKAALLARTKELSALVKAADVEQTEAASAYDDLFGRLPNIVEEGVPAGGEVD
jgi:seryl-tRNA synthetase